MKVNVMFQYLSQGKYPYLLALFTLWPTFCSREFPFTQSKLPSIFSVKLNLKYNNLISINSLDSVFTGQAEGLITKPW